MLTRIFIYHTFLFNQPYAALKAREYLDKPTIHETMVKVWPSAMIHLQILEPATFYVPIMSQIHPVSLLAVFFFIFYPLASLFFSNCCLSSYQIDASHIFSPTRPLSSFFFLFKLMFLDDAFIVWHIKVQGSSNLDQFWHGYDRPALIFLENTATFWQEGLVVVQKRYSILLYTRSSPQYRKSTTISF